MASVEDSRTTTLLLNFLSVSKLDYFFIERLDLNSYDENFISKKGECFYVRWFECLSSSLPLFENLTGTVLVTSFYQINDNLLHVLNDVCFCSLDVTDFIFNI